jgi:hypothetical protein
MSIDSATYTNFFGPKDQSHADLESGPKDQSHADLSPIFEEKFPETRCMRDIPLKKRIVLLNGHGTSSF